MKEASLPSPGVGSKSMHLRRITAVAISAMEVAATKYTNGAHPGATAFKAFLDAASAAVATIGKAIPAMTFTTAGSATSVAVSATLATTVGKDGSSGTVTYSSSDTDKATVNSSGVITGVAVGSVRITANMTEGATKKAASKFVDLTVTA